MGRAYNNNGAYQNLILHEYHNNLRVHIDDKKRIENNELVFSHLQQQLWYLSNMNVRK
jgi:hypothetical protein